MDQTTTPVQTTPTTRMTPLKDNIEVRTYYFNKNMPLLPRDIFLFLLCSSI